MVFADWCLWILMLIRVDCYTRSTVILDWYTVRLGGSSERIDKLKSYNRIHMVDIEIRYTHI